MAGLDRRAAAVGPAGEVLRVLVRSLAGSTAEPACWTIAAPVRGSPVGLGLFSMQFSGDGHGPAESTGAWQRHPP